MPKSLAGLVLTFSFDEQAKIEQNYKDIIAKASTTSGTVVLSHELNAGTMNLSMEFLPEIKKTFKGGVVPLAVCMNNTRPYVEQEYVYPDYSQWSSGTTSISLPAPTALSTNAPLVLTVSSTSSSPTSSATSTSSGSAARGSSAARQSASTSASDAQSAVKASGKPTSGAGKVGASVGALVGAVALAVFGV